MATTPVGVHASRSATCTALLGMKRSLTTSSHFTLRVNGTMGDLRPAHLLAKMQELSSGWMWMTNFLRYCIFNVCQQTSKPYEASTTIVSWKLRKWDFDPQTSAARAPMATGLQENSPEQIAGSDGWIASYENSNICWYHPKFGSQEEQFRSSCKFQYRKN